MAITAAVVGTTVATTAASMAMKAKQAKAAGKSSGLAGAGYAAPGLRERLFNRGTQDIMQSERLILDDALAQGKLLEPELYRALGLEPIYDVEDTGEYAGVSQALRDAQARQGEIRTERAALQAARPGKDLKGKAKQQAIKAKRKRLKEIERESKQANKDIENLSTQVEQAGAVGRRVIGFKPIAGVADPTGSAGNAFGQALDQFNLHLSDALAGKEPLDPTLKSSFDERERTLRERLRRQMGPDYETSTAGEQALANFDRERSEAYAQYNRQSIEGFSRLAESRATTLSELTSGRLKNLAFPATFRANLADALRESAVSRAAIAQGPQQERAMQGQAQQNLAEQQRAAAAQRQAALGQILAGVGSAAPTAGGYAQQLAGSEALFGSAGPSLAEGALGNVPRGSEFSTGGLLGYGGGFGG